MGKTINVKFMAQQGAEDLFVTVDGPKRVYVRQPANVDDLVFWLTSSKWQGGYEASSPLKAGITMCVVDKERQKLFEETLVKDDWNGGTSAKKQGPFSREALDKVLDGFEEIKGLKSYEDWKKCLLQDKEEFNNTDYDDNWLYWDTESISETVLKKFKDGLGEICYLVAEDVRQKTSGREWTEYKVVDRKKDYNTLAICGYKFDDGPMLSPEKQVSLEDAINKAKKQSHPVCGQKAKKELEL